MSAFSKATQIVRNWFFMVPKMGNKTAAQAVWSEVVKAKYFIINLQLMFKLLHRGNITYSTRTSCLED